MPRLIFILFLYVIPMFISQAQASESVTIGSKSFTESHLLGEILAILLEEKYDIQVERKFGLGGTKVAFDALRHGGIDVYGEYTGTGYVMILKEDGERDPDKVFQIVSESFLSKFGIVWSPPLGFNNTFALAVRKDDPRFLDFNKISQLAPESDRYVFASLHEFLERKDGYKRLVETYGLNFKPDNVIGLDSGLSYSAIKNKQADIVVVDSTDGRIAANNLRLLQDDLSFFPPYYASFIAKQTTLRNLPQLQVALDSLKGKISAAEMTKMNDASDRLKVDMKVIARNFLVEKGLLQTPTSPQVQYNQRQSETFWQFVKKKRVYIGNLLLEHLYLSFGAILLALALALPLGVLLTRYQQVAKVVFPIVNIIQTIPSLALLGFMIPLFGIGFTPAIIALFLYSVLPLLRNTYTGIQNVDQSYVEVSKGIGLTNTQILLQVELPLALPFILAGLRTAAVIVIGTATLAALIGAGGLGDPIFRGVSTVDSRMILLGAIPAALLAVVVDKLIGVIETLSLSPGLRLQSQNSSS